MTANMDPYGTTVLYLSANDTAQWVASNRWACSTLYGHRVRAEFDNQGDLVDLAIDGSDAIGIDGHEFDAITSDCLLGLYGPGHPAIRNSTGELKR